jgi:hypothetical protein
VGKEEARRLFGTELKGYITFIELQHHQEPAWKVPIYVYDHAITP